VDYASNRLRRVVRPARELGARLTPSPVHPTVTPGSAAMSLAPGSKLGPYEISALIGAGGMGARFEREKRGHPAAGGDDS